MEDGILELIELMENIAPHLWNIAMKQVYANIAEQIIFAIFVGLSSFFVLKFWIGRIGKYHNFESFIYETSAIEPVIWGITMICVIFFIIITIIMLSDMPSMFINPEYHAIKILMNMIP